MDGYYKTMIVLGAIGILIFAVQLLLCYKSKRTAIKLIPAYIIIFLVLFATALYVGAFGTGSFGANQILAKILAIGIGVALIGDVIAWIVYGIIIKKARIIK